MLAFVVFFKYVVQVLTFEAAARGSLAAFRRCSWCNVGPSPDAQAGSPAPPPAALLAQPPSPACPRNAPTALACTYQLVSWHCHSTKRSQWQNIRCKNILKLPRKKIQQFYYFSTLLNTIKLQLNTSWWRQYAWRPWSSPAPVWSVSPGRQSADRSWSDCEHSAACALATAAQESKHVRTSLSDILDTLISIK